MEEDEIRLTGEIDELTDDWPACPKAAINELIDSLESNSKRMAWIALSPLADMGSDCARISKYSAAYGTAIDKLNLAIAALKAARDCVE